MNPIAVSDKAHNPIAASLRRTEPRDRALQNRASQRDGGEDPGTPAQVRRKRRSLKLAWPHRNGFQMA